jgi:preprotein translocase subunit SecF
MKLLRLAPDDTRIPFMAWRRVTFPIAMGLIAASIVIWLIFGFNFGIDFSGGTLLELRNRSGPAELAQVRSTLGGLGLGDVQVQEFGQPQDILVRLPQQEGGDVAQQAAVSKVREALGENYELRRAEVVGPSVSSELRRDGVIAVVVSLFFILLYLWFRFEWQFAVGAVLTTIHDVILTLGLLSLLQISFDLPILAAILTIVGYSLNDTVVIYDRIRENLRRYKKMPLPDLIDAAINQTLARTLATSMTTFLAVLALFLFGGEALRGFNFTLLFGIIIGVYSSVAISAPILIYFNLRSRPEAVEERREAKQPAQAARP